MKLQPAVLALGLLAVAAPASAATFTSRADFIATVGAATANDLDSASDTASYDFGDFTAAAFADEPFQPDHFGFKLSGLGSGKSLQFSPPSEIATFTFDAPIFAFGLDIIGLGLQGPTDLTFTIGEVSYTVLRDYEGSDLSVAFVGFTSATGFNMVTLSTSSSGAIELDNVLYAGAVPEPSTWAIMLLGFGAVGVAVRRRRAFVI